MRATDAGFEHAAAPNWKSALATNFFHSLRLRVPADAAQFHVYHAASAEFQRMFRVFSGAYRFVEANRRFDLLLQSRVIENVVVRQRLLNHHKTKVVERFEKWRV